MIIRSILQWKFSAEHDHPVLFHTGTVPMYEDYPYVGGDHFRSFHDSLLSH